MIRPIVRAYPQEMEGVGEISNHHINRSGFVLSSVKISKAVGFVPMHN